MVRLYLPIATTVVAIHAASSVAAPLRTFEPRAPNSNLNDIAGRNLQSAVDSSGVNDLKHELPQRQVLNRRIFNLPFGIGREDKNKPVIPPVTATPAAPASPARSRSSSVGSTSSAGTFYSIDLHSGPTSPSSSMPGHLPSSSRSSSSRASSTLLPTHSSSDNSLATAKPAETPKKQPAWKVYAKGAVEEVQKNPVRTLFGGAGTILASVAIHHTLFGPGAHKRRDLDSSDPMLD